MSILPTFNTKDRTTVPTPEAIKLFKGPAFLALGIIGLSFFVTELPVIARLIFMTLGVIFAVFGIRLISRYLAEYKTYKNFDPKWDERLGMFDKFAMELNAWHEDATPPTCCDGNTIPTFPLINPRRTGNSLSR